jgi:tetratricopeptide (TPR) repeat protein
MAGLVFMALYFARTKAVMAANLTKLAADLNDTAARQRATVKDEIRLAKEAEDAKDRVTSNLISTQNKVVKLLESIGPLLGTNSKSREQVLECAEELQDNESADMTNPDVQLGEADLARVYSTLYIKLGNDKAARNYAEKARQIVQKWVEKHPENLELKCRLVDCYNTIGDAYLGGRDPETLKHYSHADCESAIQSYDAGLSLAQGIMAANPRNQKWQELVISSWNNKGDVQLALSQPDDAKKSYEAARRLVEQLLQQSPNDPDLSESLAVVNDHEGDVLLSQDQPEQAWAMFQNSYEIRCALAKSAPPEKAAASKSALAQSFNKLGRACANLGRNKEALGDYQKALDYRIELAKQDTKNHELLRDLAYSYNNVGGALLGGYNGATSQADRKQAIGYFEQRVNILKGLYDEDPTNADWRIDYAGALNRCADTLLNVPDKDLRDWAKALEYSRIAVELNENEPRFLCVRAQAMRLNGMSADGRKLAEHALSLLPPPQQRGPEQKSVADDLQKELKASAREQTRPN